MINKDDFKQINFISHGIIENKKRGYNRVPNDWRPGNSNTSELRKKILDIVWEKADEYKEKKQVKISDYSVIETLCRIPYDTIKKAISGRYKITRNFLAKFTVGLKLTVEEANELFIMHSGELNLTNDFDYIVFHALKTHDEIDFFLNELDQYLGINLDKDRL